MTNLFSLEGKVALVTGAAYGIGFAMAEALANAGAEIAFNCRGQEHMDKALAEYEAKGIKAHGYICDVTNEADVQKMVADIRQELGHIDILVNNAGIIKRIPMHEMTREEFQQVIDIDLVGPFIMTKAVIPEMIERREGKIINICSMMSELGRETVSAYAAAKARRLNHCEIIVVVTDCNRIFWVHSEDLSQAEKSLALIDSLLIELEIAVRRIADECVAGDRFQIFSNLLKITDIRILEEDFGQRLVSKHMYLLFPDRNIIHTVPQELFLALIDVINVDRVIRVDVSTYIIALAGVKDHLHFLISDSLEVEPSVILIFRDCSAVKRDDVLILLIPEPELLQSLLNCRVTAPARRHELDAHF